MKKCLALALWMFCSAQLVRANCVWSDAPDPIDFGTYQPLSGGALSVTAPFIVRCTPNSSGTVTISQGTAPASYTPRTLKGPGGATLPYNFFLDATYTSIWGDGTGGSSTPPGYSTGAGGGNTFFNGSLYARIPAGSDAPAGTYLDTVTVDIVDGMSKDTYVLTIRAVVARECTVASFSINFGAYDTVGANEATPLDATAPIDVRCTGGTSATVSLDSGLYMTGGARRMRSAAGDFLSYNVFRDAARTSAWTNVTTKSGTAVSKDTPVSLAPGGSVLYGRVFAGQDVPAGTYTDTLQATVNY